ncbi:MAG: DUF47 family protein [Eubacteriaceae bacterium]|nr:DUF47 family protein [Eubacteriaceae bacterium]
MARRKGNEYFLLMKQMAMCANTAALKLKDVLDNFEIGNLQEMMLSLSEIEHYGDTLKHQMTELIAKGHMTPIERGDIVHLAYQLEELVDCIEDVIIKIYMFNIKQINDDALTLVDLACQCTNEMVVVFVEFSDFKRSRIIHKSIVEINRLEEVADRVYIEAVRDLHENSTDPFFAMSWFEIYTCLENCCDMCESTVDLVESVILKNS